MTLPDRMRQAADTLEEASALYGFGHPGDVAWSPQELRTEAAMVEADDR